MISQRINGRLDDVIGVFRIDRLDPSKSPFSFDQRQEFTAALTAHHQVDFLVADTLLLFDDERTLVNRNAIWD